MASETPGTGQAPGEPPSIPDRTATCIQNEEGSNTCTEQESETDSKTETKMIEPKVERFIDEFPKSLPIALVFSPSYGSILERHPRHKLRYKLWYGLCKAYGLLSNERVRLVTPIAASADELRQFHDEDYISFLKAHAPNQRFAHRAVNGKGAEAKATSTLNCSTEESDLAYLALQKEFGLQDDCYVFEGLYEYILFVAGGTLTAVEELAKGRAKVAINWGGGRHHAMPGMASGFCYVGDACLAIQKLTDVFKRVLYIDIDVHHGDGVEQAFYYNEEVFTLSFHRYDTGFFPGSGALKDAGVGEGLYRNLNIPLKSGISDEQYIKIFSRIFPSVVRQFKPGAVVVVCGCDGLAQDKLGGNFNLTSRSLEACVAVVLSKGVPTLLLGGGGYDAPTVARCWSILTARAAQLKLPRFIPEHCFYEHYSPDFNLHTRSMTTRPNYNDSHSISVLASGVRAFFSKMASHNRLQYAQESNTDDKPSSRTKAELILNNEGVSSIRPPDAKISNKFVASDSSNTSIETNKPILNKRIGMPLPKVRRRKLRKMKLISKEISNGHENEMKNDVTREIDNEDCLQPPPASSSSRTRAATFEFDE